MKKRLFLSLVIILITLTSLILWKKPVKENQSSKISVVTTIFPLYDFVRQVGGDKVEVQLLLPPGVEAHHFEPTPQTLLMVNRSNLLVYTSSQMEPWVTDILSSLDQTKNTILAAGQKTKQLGTDPHVWLDFENTQIMVENIAQALIQQDPIHADFYRNNANQYQQQLQQLDQQYQILLRCPQNTIVYGGHYALGYLANRYHLVYLAAQGMASEAEPTAEDLVNLINQVKQNNIQYIFYEELTSPKVAQTLAQETGAQLLLLSAAHNLSQEDLTRGKTFMQIMRENLNNLKQGLSCS